MAKATSRSAPMVRTIVPTTRELVPLSVTIPRAVVIS
jgi:hypothetical protein